MVEKPNEMKGGLPPEAFANADDQIRLRTDRFRQVYANNLRINISSWDLGLTFGEITGEKDGQPIIEETVKVLMTREIAKVLSILLRNHVEAYEATFGEIRIPVTPKDAEAAGAEPQRAEADEAKPSP